MGAGVVIPVAIIIVLVILNAFFVAAEFAIASVPRTKITQLADAGSGAAQNVLAVLRDDEMFNNYISTAQVGITIASLGLGMYGEHVVAEWLLEPLEHIGFLSVAAAHTIATVLSVGILTYLHVVIGEMIPKTLALQSATGTALFLSSSMSLAERVFRPFTAILNALGAAILRLTGLTASGTEGKLISSEELAYIVEESSESGMLAPDEQLYLENVFDFHERSVSQIMTPRTRMVALPVDSDYASALATVTELPHSRYPVYAGDRDHIVGILHLKDLARHVVSDIEEFDLAPMVRPPVFVPESLSLEATLAQFRDNHIQVAVIVDEYGGTAGIATLEDLAEELIGEIQDEFDHEIPPLRELSAEKLQVRGDLQLDELTQHYDIEFETIEAETVGGLIMESLGQVAKRGASVEYAGLIFKVESVEGLAVRTATITFPRNSE